MQNFSTEETAAEFKVEPNTIRTGLSRHGHYLGLRPVKLPNGRLLWSGEAVRKLINGSR